MKETAIIIIVTLLIFAVLFVVADRIDKANAAEITCALTTNQPELEAVPVYDMPMPEEHQEIVRYWCQQLDVDERMVYGVIFAESNFNNDAVNPNTGCFGYMQLNPSVYQRERFSDPKANLTAGIMELARLRCIYRDATMVLMCYNNGEAGAHRLLVKGLTSTAYTRKVLAYAETLKTKGRL